MLREGELSGFRYLGDGLLDRGLSSETKGGNKKERGGVNKTGKRFEEQKCIWFWRRLRARV